MESWSHGKKYFFEVSINSVDLLWLMNQIRTRVLGEYFQAQVFLMVVYFEFQSHFGFYIDTSDKSYAAMEIFRLGEVFWVGRGNRCL